MISSVRFAMVGVIFIFLPRLLRVIFGSEKNGGGAGFGSAYHIDPFLQILASKDSEGSHLKARMNARRARVRAHKERRLKRAREAEAKKTELAGSLPDNEKPPQ